MSTDNLKNNVSFNTDMRFQHNKQTNSQNKTDNNNLNSNFNSNFNSNSQFSNNMFVEQNNAVLNKKKESVKNKTIAAVIGAILLLVSLPVIIFNGYIILQGFINPDKAPNINGITPLIVLTESMKPTIDGGDLIIVDKADASNVHEGDIIAYFDPASKGETSIVTHRVVEVEKSSDNSILFKTKGDANNTEDSKKVSDDKLVGIYNGTKFAGIGNICMWLKSAPGIIVCVGIPLLLLVGFDIYRRKKYAKEQSDREQQLKAELEQLKSKQANYGNF